MVHGHAPQTEPATPPEDGAAASDGVSLGSSLGPALREHCAGRLGKIDWFRATWQHGGAATGFAEWTFDDGRRTEALVKLPVGFQEYSWTMRLGAVDAEDWDKPDARDLPTPRVLAAGEQLGRYDFAWIVTERLAGQPIGMEPTKAELLEIFDAAADFHARAERVSPVAGASSPARHNWEELIARARAACRDNDIPERQRWNDLLRRVDRHLGALVRRWRARPIDTWCHGDLHGHNAMRRGHAPGDDRPGRCVLIDLALVRAGSWVEDAVYLERLFWGCKDRLRGVKPVSALARARRARELPVTDGYAELADLRRLLMAATAPAFLGTEGHPAHLKAAVGHVERLLPRLTG